MTRRVLLVLAVVATACSLTPGSGAGAQEAPPPIEASGEGWWNLLSIRPETELGALVPSPAAPAPDVPEGSIPVSARVGQTEKVAAIGVVLTAPPGGTVTSATLTLREVDEATAQLRAEDATVVACPIVEFFVPAQNADLANAPEVDCEAASATGERGEDGTWTFDITPLVALWLEGTVPANGIRFDPTGDAGETFQVTFTGEEEAVFVADITGGASDDPFDLGGGAGTPPPSGVGGSGDFGGTDSSLDLSPPTVESPTVEDPDGPPATDDDGGGTEEVAAPAGDDRAGVTFGNWTFGLFVALVGGLLLALLVAWSLGNARPVEAAVRPQRGVSRALAARNRLTRSETL